MGSMAAVDELLEATEGVLVLVLAATEADFFDFRVLLAGVGSVG